MTHAASSQKSTDTALIFEGGGMRAAYTSGFVVEMLARGFEFPFLAGISAGTSTAVNYLTKDPVRARRSFVELAADPQFGSLRTFVRGQGLFNSDYIYQRTAEADQALPLDWQTFTDNPAELSITAFNARTGEDAEWTRADISTVKDLLIRVQASSTMPVLMPEVHLDGEVYVDGALGQDGGIALSAAQRAGYDRFLVVLTQQRDYVKAPQRFSSVFRAYFRRFPQVACALATRHERYNTTRARLFELERQGKAYIFAPEAMTLSNGTRDLRRLAAAHRAGRSQTRREMPGILDFLGH